jgi:hypothetical protein
VVEVTNEAKAAILADTVVVVVEWGDDIDGVGAKKLRKHLVGEAKKKLLLALNEARAEGYAAGYEEARLSRSGMSK